MTPGWLSSLDAHRPSTPEESQDVKAVRDFVLSTPHPYARSTLSGHVTGSAVVLDSKARALLLHHARLGLWVQPGGHMDAVETDPAVAALREAIEETGLDDLVLDGNDDGPAILDVDVHLIPESVAKSEPAHLHHDVCFLARTLCAAEARFDPNESRAMAWVSASELDDFPLDPVTRRRLEKAFARDAG